MMNSLGTNLMFDRSLPAFGRLCSTPIFLILLSVIGLAALIPRSAAAEMRTCDQKAELPVPINRFSMKKSEFMEAASVLFYRCHRWISPADTALSTFQANVDFPTKLPNTSQLPWNKIHPIEEPQRYLDAVLKYAIDRCGKDHLDWDGAKCGWFHAPWMHDLREPMRGLTKERSSRLGELHPSQTKRTENWAVGLYNEIGGHGFHRIWGENKAYPDTKNFAFDNGTMAVKLLFSLATPEHAPYLRYAKTWDIHDGEKIVKARLIQVDVLVKDDRVSDGKNPPPHDDLTGWVMGSYLYNGMIETSPRCDRISKNIEACEQARWRDRLVPIGLQWGNDPQMYATNRQGEPVQHWLGQSVTKMFEPLRLMSGHPSYLGYDGRMNGPVDNHRSTCLACHSRAIDFGRYEKDALRLIPFVPFADPTNDVYPEPAIEELRRFFRNLNSNEPFLEGTQSLDYSLQATVGLHQFRKWVNELPLNKDLKKDTAYIEPSYVSPDAITKDLKIATWNIANLHHETGVPLRLGAEKREEIDYERLAKVAQDLNADLVALQEIGSVQALARIFSPEEYHLVMSNRYRPGDELRAPPERDIYTAFAFSRNTFPKVPKVKTIEALSMPHMQWDEDTAVDQERPTRAGMSVEFEFQGDRYSVLNLHLKSGCNSGSLTNPNEFRRHLRQRFACRTLTAQLEMVENWFELQNARGRKIMMMGDFNRRLNWQKEDTDKLDDFWVDLNDEEPIKLVKGPVDGKENCWPGHSKSKASSVDFIVLGSNVISSNELTGIKKTDYGFSDETAFPEYAGEKFHRLSDHCPVSVELKHPYLPVTEQTQSQHQ